MLLVVACIHGSTSALLYLLSCLELKPMLHHKYFAPCCCRTCPHVIAMLGLHLLPMPKLLRDVCMMLSNKKVPITQKLLQ